VRPPDLLLPFCQEKRKERKREDKRRRKGRNMTEMRKILPAVTLKK
jgi:hypothetical protein